MDTVTHGDVEVTGPRVTAEADCESILRSRPDWFGIESAIVSYVRDTGRLPTFLAHRDGRACGFVSLKEHFTHSWEVHCEEGERRHRELVDRWHEVVE